MKKKRRKYTCLVGLDLSLRNPGVCIQLQTDETKEPEYHFIYFANDVDQCFNQIYNSRIHLHHLPIQPEPKSFRFEIDRFRILASQITDKIFSIIKDIPVKRVLFLIENFAFREKDTSNLTRLAESASLIKSAIREKGYKYKLYPCTTVKKHFAGYGKADKEQMFLALQHSFPEIANALQTHFKWDYKTKKTEFINRQTTKRLTEERVMPKITDSKWAWLDDEPEKQSIQQKLLKGKRKREPPSLLAPVKKMTKMKIMNPLEDLVDAMGLVITRLKKRGHIK